MGGCVVVGAYYFTQPKAAGSVKPYNLPSAGNTPSAENSPGPANAPATNAPPDGRFPDLPGTPSREETAAAVKLLISNLNQAVQTRDFTAFYGYVAKRWQAQTSPEKLQETFGPAEERGIALSAAAAAEPDMESVNVEGEKMTLEGDYHVQPREFHFILIFEKEEGDWKVINISLKPKQQ